MAGRAQLIVLVGLTAAPVGIELPSIPAGRRRGLPARSARHAPAAAPEGRPVAEWPDRR
jgi:hypothetical protein